MNSVMLGQEERIQETQNLERKLIFIGKGGGGKEKELLANNLTQRC